MYYNEEIAPQEEDIIEEAGEDLSESAVSEISSDHQYHQTI